MEFASREDEEEYEWEGQPHAMAKLLLARNHHRHARRAPRCAIGRQTTDGSTGPFAYTGR